MYVYQINHKFIPDMHLNHSMRIISFRTFILLIGLLAELPCDSQGVNKIYSEQVTGIARIRDSLKIKYEETDSIGRAGIIRFARGYILSSITSDLFPAWYGTEWDFNGTSKIPGQGSIACGYFVTYILSDAGFNIPVVRWAQLASETFILKLCTDITRFSNRPVQDVINYVNRRPDGIYIVGLDCHVGFIFKKGTELKFVHSNYYMPEIGVMSEAPDSRNPLTDSQYRVIGSVLSDRNILK